MSASDAVGGALRSFPPGSAGQAGVKSWTLDIKRRLNTPDEFRGEIENRDDAFLHSKGGKTGDELVARWNEEHPDAPVE